MCCKGSFVSNALDDLSEGPNGQSFGLEGPELVGLIKFKGPIKELPRYGDTFFQLEKVEGQAGMVIFVIIHILFIFYCNQVIQFYLKNNVELSICLHLSTSLSLIMIKL